MLAFTGAADLGESPENDPEFGSAQDLKLPTLRVNDRMLRVGDNALICGYAAPSRCQESDRRFLQVT
jgi:hypothetical protein